MSFDEAKKKLNMYKRQERKEKEEVQGEGRRSSWQNFAKKNKTVQKVKNGHDPNWDPTRDHGELSAFRGHDFVKQHSGGFGVPQRPVAVSVGDVHGIAERPESVAREAWECFSGEPDSAQLGPVEGHVHGFEVTA